MIYRLWTVGSHRLLLWADPGYAARFTESCRLGGGEGFEIFAPLTNKGYENLPGTWPIFADPDFQSYQWEQQRYWFYYLAFGRMGYNPDCHPEVWQRELRNRFGAASEDVETAYLAASQILPLITATRMPSVSEWRWWPEMDTGGTLHEYMHTPPSDTAQFFGIRTWRQTPQWWREPWDEFPPGYVESAMGGQVSGRTTPPQVSVRLHQLSRETLHALEQANTQWLDSRTTSKAKLNEFRATRLDLTIHALLAKFHAEKTLAATHLAFFETNEDAARLPLALKHMEQAQAAWKKIVQLTERVYHSNLLFGHGKDSKRSRAGHHHGGHWKDRLAQIESDIAYLEKLLERHPSRDTNYRSYAMESISRERPTMRHDPPDQVNADKDVAIRAEVTSPREMKQVRLYYRPLDQTADWKHIVMDVIGNYYETSISREEISGQFDLMYYFELIDTKQGALWPSWDQRQPYFVVPVHSD